MIELKTKKKYFDAILQLKKPFGFRHKPIPKNSVVKLVEITQLYMDKKPYSTIPTGRYIIFKSGECYKLEKTRGSNEFSAGIYEDTENGEIPLYIFDNDTTFYKQLRDPYVSGYDNFCGDYINAKQTYLIEIAKILEVK